MSSLQGKVALVTGGARGVGRSISIALAAEGAAVAVDDLYRDESGSYAADATAADIRRMGVEAVALREDVTSEEGAQRMADAVIQKFGRIDILVTCAGNFVRAPLVETTKSQWDSVINLHLNGHFLSCKAVLPQMQKQNSGRIVTVASRGAFSHVPAHKRLERVGRAPSSVSYAAAKAGILGFTTTLALELWETGINVNCLLPSATTQLFPGTAPRMTGNVPATQSLDPDDLAPAVVFLCGPAAVDISGKLMYASGGDLVFYGEQLDVAGSRMIRKVGRWTQEELGAAIPSLLGIPAQ